MSVLEGIIALWVRPVGPRCLVGNRRGRVLALEVALGRARGECGCRGMRRGRGEPGGEGRVDGQLAPGSSVRSDRHGSASADGTQLFRVRPLVSPIPGLLRSALGIATASGVELCVG